jgi:hypothetical protein
MRAILLAAAVMFAGPAAAQSADAVITDSAVGRAAPSRAAPAQGVVTSTDINGLIAALQRAGFTAEAKTEGRQTYALGRLNTTPFQAFLGGCNPSGGQCTEIELYAGFSGTQHMAWQRINGWNARTRFARAFLDEDGDPALQMDIGLSGGVAPDGLKAALETWGTALETYSLFLIARTAPVGGPPQSQPEQQPPAAQSPGR